MMGKRPRGRKYRNLGLRGGVIWYERVESGRRVRFSTKASDWDAAAAVRDEWERRRDNGRSPRAAQSRIARRCCRCGRIDIRRILPHHDLDRTASEAARQRGFLILPPSSRPEGAAMRRTLIFPSHSRPGRVQRRVRLRVRPSTNLQPAGRRRWRYQVCSGDGSKRCADHREALTRNLKDMTSSCVAPASCRGNRAAMPGESSATLSRLTNVKDMPAAPIVSE